MIESLTPALLAEFFVWFLVFLFSLTLHEGAHALLARLGGDDTAYLGGQVSLNPLPHIRREPMGTILVPTISFFLLGWTMGWASTPYDPLWAQRHPKRHALMSAAGPAANLIIAAASMILLRSLIVGGLLEPPDARVRSYSRLADPVAAAGDASWLWPLSTALSIALTLNVLLFLFNLIPIPPMDGSGVLHGLFPDTVGRLIESMRSNQMMGLLGLLVAWKLIPFIFHPVFAWIIARIYAAA